MSRLDRRGAMRLSNAPSSGKAALPAAVGALGFMPILSACRCGKLLRAPNSGP